MQIQAAYRSDCGDRQNNEDKASVLDDARLLMVADGMGGERGGEIASGLSVETAAQSLPALRACKGERAILVQLQRTFQQANELLLETARHTSHLQGMGTTLTLAFFRGEHLYFAHIGDSRIYLWREGSCRQLSQDHTRGREFVERGLLSAEQARHSPPHNLLTRYLGTVAAVKPQLDTVPLRVGDRLLLCSDGLYNCLEHQALTALLGDDDEPDAVAENLVLNARRDGGQNLDNITALVAFVAR